MGKLCIIFEPTENLAFRAFWIGTNKLLTNAIFYGPIIEAGSAR